MTSGPGRAHHNTALATALLLAGGLSLACCSPSGGLPDGAAADRGPAADAVAETARDSGPAREASSSGASLSGQVVDLTGKPLSGAGVAACGAVCVPAITDAQGWFAFSDLPAGTYYLDARRAGTLPASLSATVFSLELTAGQSKALQRPVVLADTGAGTTLSPGSQQVPVDSELTLTVDVAALKLPQGQTRKYLAGVKVPASYWPPYSLSHGGQGYTARAMWALNPFDASSSVALGARLSTTLGLTSGQSAALFEVDPVNGLARWAADAVVSGDGKQLQTAAGKGLGRVTWLIVGTR